MLEAEGSPPSDESDESDVDEEHTPADDHAAASSEPEPGCE